MTKVADGYASFFITCGCSEHIMFVLIQLHTCQMYCCNPFFTINLQFTHVTTPFFIGNALGDSFDCVLETRPDLASQPHTSHMGK